MVSGIWPPQPASLALGRDLSTFDLSTPRWPRLLLSDSTRLRAVPSRSPTRALALSRAQATRTPLSPAQSAQVRAVVNLRRPLTPSGSGRAQVVESGVPSRDEDPWASVRMGLGLAGTAAGLGSLFRPSLSPVASGLNLAKGGLTLARGAETGDAAQLASGAASTVGGAAGLLRYLNIAPKVTGPLSAITGPATLGLGLAEHDPSSVISGAVGTVAGGMTLAGTAPATTVGAVAAPLALVPAVSMLVGGMREQAIEKGYRDRAREAVNALAASPDVRQIGFNIARVRAGWDVSAAVDSLIRAATEAAKAGNALLQPQGGSTAGLDPLRRAVWPAIQAAGAYERALIEVAHGIGFDIEDAGAAYDVLVAHGVGPAGERPAGSPPSRWSRSEPSRVAGLGGDVRGGRVPEIRPPSAYTPPPGGPPAPTGLAGWVQPTGDVRGAGTAPQPVVNNWIPQARHPAGMGWLNVVTGEWRLGGGSP